MIILGIDPGLAIVGYSLLEMAGNKMKLLEFGSIVTSSEMHLPERLMRINQELNLIIRDFKPSDMAIEELFFYKNAKTIIEVSQARGVQVLAGIQNGLEIYEYTPLQIKQAIVGYGRADKRQVQESIRMLLNLSEIPKPDDAADALAVAMCHGFGLKFKEQFKIK